MYFNIFTCRFFQTASKFCTPKLDVILITSVLFLTLTGNLGSWNYGGVQHLHFKKYVVQLIRICC